MTGAGLGLLVSLQSLSQFVVEETDDELAARLAPLKDLSCLKSLTLGWCERLTDAGLAHLKGLVSLASLSLFKCNQVTDAGLAHLKGLSSLQSLMVHECERVTDSGIATLKQALPRCWVYKW
jgi:hypothetical protein